MIKRLGISRYKCFDRIDLELRGLTIFSGMNSSGKSSALQPLLLLAQALKDGRNIRVIPLNGSLVRLGAASDVVREGSSEPLIEFSVFSSDMPAPIKLLWGLKPSHRFLYRHAVEDASVSAVDSDEMDFIQYSGLEKLIYISAHRAALADCYPPIDSFTSKGDVGSDGRYAAFWYNEYADYEVSGERCLPDEEATSFRKQVDAWMSYLFGEAQVNVAATRETSVLNLRFRTSATGDWKQPANVGYGYSYAFPLIVALLLAERGQILVVDSPEAHLHPCAQSRMGRMLAHFASSGVQVLVETHSDHLLNGCRLAVKNKFLQDDRVQVYFFRMSADGSKADAINIEADGRLNKWPRGFFDQIEEDLARL